MQTNHTVAAAASKVMAQQDWYPEIVVTSAPYQDLDLFARGYDQKVWSHAFGMVWFPPYLAGHADETATAFQWFWGTDKGTRSRSRSSRCSACTRRSSSSART